MSLKLKTILGVAIIEALLLALLVSMTLNYLKTTNYDGLIKRATTTVTLFSTTTKDAVLSYDLASLEAFTSELMKNPDLKYVKILTPNGDVFTQAGEADYLQRPFVEDHDVALVSDGVFDISAKIEEGGHLFGLIHLGIDTSELNQKIQEARYWSAIIAGIEMIMVALFSYLLGTYLIGRLSQLREAANQISRGETDVTVTISGADEVTDVAHAFNKMSSRLQEESQRRTEYEEELQELNRTLENRVERRTEQLSQNIAKLKSMNETLKHTHAQLVQSEKMASIGTLAAGVAHEINNPVGFVMSNVRTLASYIKTYEGAIERIQALLIQEESQPGIHRALHELGQWLNQQDIDFLQEDVSGLLSDTLEGTERIRDIVVGLKEFSHTDQDKVMKSADVNEAILKTLKIAHNELKYKSQVETELGDIPPLICNIGQIQQVLLNIVINAGHAIKENGLIKIKSGMSDNHVFISVEDNGCGIDPLIQQKIFDPFFTTKEIGKGTGLGLSIAYSIMEEHQGQIKVETDPGKGSKFTLYFPFPQLSD
ncbi:sensor histidine kinase [Vibrio mangrovi]|uniref:histidine kinase n=1 Tax=Vibrio mangrovi TaxID=474394 RepID=A0A1Y6IQT5_9VIBR|nr:ATP-binding protein [Vibrio mangrovi]MDW6003216.1 ATP-binding protein [Vibrio mangrovi]SMR99996.1 Sporulation kinase E [Vibrio mangrovi]